MNEEGYAGLVVHGPLQANYLLLMAAKLRAGHAPARFVFRGTAPLIAGADFSVNGLRGEGDEDRLWISDGNGVTTMLATAIHEARDR